MLEENVVIANIVERQLVRDGLGYVRKALINCYGMYQKRGWKLEHIRVRIGRTGNGTAPHYRIEYASDEFDESKVFVEGRFNRRGSPTEFSGQNHEATPFGFDKSHWSTEVQSVEALEQLRDRLMKRNS